MRNIQGKEKVSLQNTTPRKIKMKQDDVQLGQV